MFIGDYLARRCVYNADEVAILDASADAAKPYTFKQLDHRANALAAWLQQHGLNKGDRVAMLAPDGVCFYDAFFACGKIGAVLAPLSWRLSAHELSAQIELIKPKILFYGSDKAIQTLVDQLHGKSQEVMFTEIETMEATVSKAGESPRLCESLTERDTACLLFTGGTTGQPKAAQMSHGQIVWNTFNSYLGDVLGSDTFLNIFPLFHSGGLFAFSVPILIQGGTVIQTQRFDAEQVLSLIEKERATIFGGVPTIFQMLTTASNWTTADLSSLRYCMSGGAPMPVSLIQKYRAEKGVVFRQGFGLTEFGPGVFSLAGEDAERKAGSIGKPNFFVDAKIVRPETGEPVRQGDVGELMLRGPSATTGYFNDTKATEALFEDDGFLHTGDLARIDEEGYFFIVDRLKEMYISGGENVFPSEIEALLYKHPDVELCAVIGVPDEKWGQSGEAFVVLKKDAEITEQGLLSYLAEKLAKFKVPRALHFREAMPVSGAGKILKRKLRKQIDKNES